MNKCYGVRKNAYDREVMLVCEDRHDALDISENVFLHEKPEDYVIDLVCIKQDSDMKAMRDIESFFAPLKDMQ